MGELISEVDQVKKSESGMIVDPVTVDPDKTIGDVLRLMEQYRISGVPVIKVNRLVGIVTNRDLRFETQLEKKVSEVMTKENLVTVSEGIDLEESKKLLHEHRIEKLLVVDSNGRLKGMITIKDIEKIKKYPNSCKDSMGRLRVGAAVGVGPDMLPRTEALLKAGADVIVIDTCHGHSENVIQAVKKVKGNFSSIQLVAVSFLLVRVATVSQKTGPRAQAVPRGGAHRLPSCYIDCRAARGVILPFIKRLRRLDKEALVRGGKGPGA